MWILDSEFEPLSEEAYVVSVQRWGWSRMGRLRQWDGEGAGLAARSWLVGRYVCGYNVRADLRVLGLVDGVDVQAWDVWGWLYGQHDALRGASLDELVESMFGARPAMHGIGPDGLRLRGERLRRASANGVWWLGAVIRYMLRRGRVWWDGRGWPVDVDDLMMHLIAG